MTKSFFNIIFFFLLGCQATHPSVITKEYNADGVLVKETIGTVNNQVAYHNTMRQRDVQITKEPPLFEIKRWSAVQISKSQSVILPVLAVHERKERASIERTPTTGEITVSGINGFMERLGIPLAIGGITTTSVQQSRTSEEVKPNATAGGDIVQAERSGAAVSDKSRPVSVQESFNEEIITETTETTNE